MKKKRLKYIKKNKKKISKGTREKKTSQRIKKKKISIKTKKFLEKMIGNLIVLKQYRDYDYPDYKGIRDVENLFGKVNEDYITNQ